MATLPDIVVSRGSNLRERVRVKKAKLGDGYTQVATDGINHIEMTYEAKWETRLLTELATLVDFLRARGGVKVFAFTVPGEATPRQWRCEKWSETRISAQYGNLTATFIEDYSL